jgi:hypothetical protein
MRLYALGVLDTYNLWGHIKNISLAIAQPRLDEEVQIWEDSLEDLKAFRTEAARRIAIIESGKGEFKASAKGCRFCPAKGECATHAVWATEQAEIEFATLAQQGQVATPACASLTPEQLVRIWKAGKTISDWLKAVNDRIYQLLAAGVPGLGLKLVEGKSQRKWTNEGDAMDALVHLGFKADDFAPRSLAGLGAVQSLFDNAKLREEFMRAHTTKPPGKATIADVDDPRPAFTVSDFPDADAEGEL